MSALKRILAATSVRDVVSALNDLSDEARLSWRPVGGRENNLSTINLGSDPAAGVIERITNAIDAIIDLEWEKKGRPAHLGSPRAAVEEWFGIESGSLSNIENLRDENIVDLSQRIQVTLRDSERDDRPSVDIRDYGTGLLAEDFSKTILSLNENRKLNKLFLAGAFGQGGSTALAYSLYTIICSRKVRAENSDKPNPVAVSVVRFDPGNPKVDKHGVYQYLIDSSTGQPFTIEISEEEFPSGTLVRHVSMDLGKYKAIMTAPTGSLWWLAHNYLFDPVLPFRISDARGERNEVRTVAGNDRRLTQGEDTEYQREARLTFRSGEVSIKWWVLSADGSSAMNRITNYTMISKPIIVTYNGQKQGDFPNSVIKTDLKLPYLDRYLIVHVDCDKLDAESRRQLFPTTRESIRDTSLGEELRLLVTDTLNGDDELKRLDKERKQRYIRSVDNASVENIRKRLAKRIKAVTQSSGNGTAPRVLPPDEPSPPQSKPPIPVQDPPTFLEITGPDPKTIYPGRRFTIKFKTDADPMYFVRPDSFIALIDPPSIGHYSGTTNVRSGYGTAYFHANDDVEIGATAKITFEVRPSRSVSLSAAVSVEVVKLPESAGTGPGATATPNVNPVWVSEGDAFWVDNGWNKESVAAVNEEEDSVDIYVSADNSKFNAQIARAQRRDTSAVDALKDFYLEHISYFAYIAHADRRNSVTEESDDDSGQQVHQLELKHACDMVCGIIENLFDILVERSPAEDSHGLETAAGS